MSELMTFESPEEALQEAVRSLGGAKKVATMLWPDKGADQGSRKLHDALNTARDEKLDISQVMFILRAARDVGTHAPFLWLAESMGYEARPIARDEEVDRLTSAIEHATHTLQQSLAQLERLQAGSVRRVA